jgi:hypothetical protein
MPHEVLAMLMKHLEETGATNEQGKAWDLVVKWCVMAAQKDVQGDSLVLSTVKEVTEGDDSYFEQWVEQQLNPAMGVRPAQEPLGGMSLTAQSNTVPAQFATELSKGLAMGLKPLVPLSHQQQCKWGTPKWTLSRVTAMKIFGSTSTLTGARASTLFGGNCMHV